MRARSFFYVCAGVLMLAVAYQLGASRAEAQLGGEFTGIHVDTSRPVTTAITANGDIYARGARPDCNANGILWSGASSQCNWTYLGNVLGGTLSIKPSTMGEVKGKYRDED